MEALRCAVGYREVATSAARPVLGWVAGVTSCLLASQGWHAAAMRNGQILVRPGSAEDTPFVREMARHAATLEERPLPPADSEDVLELLPDRADAVVVAEEQSQARLGAAWWTTQGEPLVSHLAQAPEVCMAVAPASRGRGVGTALLRALIDEAERREVGALVLNVHLRNAAALRLYMASGFRVAGAGRGWFGVAMARTKGEGSSIRTAGRPAAWTAQDGVVRITRSSSSAACGAISLAGVSARVEPLVLGIPVSHEVVEAWCGWLAPPAQPFLVGEWPHQVGERRTSISPELRDTFALYNEQEALPQAVWLSEEEFLLLRAFAGEHGPSFVEERLAEIQRLLDEREQLGQPVEVPLLSAADGYDAWSGTYDDPGNGLLGPDLARVTSMIEGHRGGAALDAACGTGRYAEWLLGQGYEVVGVDSSPGMLKVAREKLPDVDFRDGDLRGLPVPTGSADLAVCALALTHVQDLARPYQELARVLKPGGRLVVSDTHSLYLTSTRYPLVRQLPNGAWSSGAVLSSVTDSVWSRSCKAVIFGSGLMGQLGRGQGACG